MSRRVGLVLLALALTCAAGAPAHAQSVAATCDTPPADRDGCNRWYTTGSVILDWNWNPAAITTTGCEGATFTTEGRVDRSCSVEWLDTKLTKKIWIGIDRTPPQLVDLHPSHPPSANGWFNRPVELSFRGSDATSGVASCSTTTYGGPDGFGVPISGSCRDMAGNVASGSLPLNYDATPPPRPSVDALPGNRRVSLEWSQVAGAAAEVVRFRQGAEPAVVFRGAGDHVTDRRLRNGRRYRYVLTLTDQAGNQAADGVTAVPTRSALLLPARNAHVDGAPTLVWKPVRRAHYYNAQLLRHGRKILTRWPRVPELRLKRTWRFDGRRRSLVPARYCWYVWPGFGDRSQRRYGHLLGKSCFTVVGS